LYFANTDFKKQRKGSDFNGWVGKKTVFPEKKTFTNDLGLEVEYNETNKLQARRKYPLLLEIHGGPKAMYQAKKACGMSTNIFVVGYGIVYSNPRIRGYGLDFLRANINDWGKVLPAMF
jgi:dipeptidyl aminopeptidase/acylaminoacyl peptidase